MPPENFKCNQCGNCCINLGDAFSTCTTEEDLSLWKEEGRDDILEWVGYFNYTGIRFNEDRALLNIDNRYRTA